MEKQLVAPQRIDNLHKLINEADAAGTAMQEEEDLGTLDYNYATFVSKLIKARGSIDSLINSATNAYAIRTEGLEDAS